MKLPKSESNIQSEIHVSMPKETILFRNNVGVMKIANRKFSFGLHKGSSDFIGWTERKITLDMVGNTVAIFTAIEVKKPGGAIRPEQTLFIQRVKDCGGLAGIARSVADALRIVRV